MHLATPIGIWLLISSCVIFYFCIAQLKQAEAEIQRLKKENEVVREKLKTAEVKNRDNIVKLKNIEELEMNLTAKVTELLHLQTVVRDLEKEKMSLKNVQKLQSICILGSRWTPYGKHCSILGSRPHTVNRIMVLWGQCGPHSVNHGTINS